MSATPATGATPATPATPATGASASASTAPTASASFTDDEVAKVAAAAEETRRLNAEGQAKIAAATTPEAKAKAQAELQTALQGAVTATGLTVSRYNEIAKAAATDAALAARLTTTAKAGAAQGEAAPASTTAPQ
jgi:hypothetical protein